MWALYSFVLALLSFQAVVSVPHSLTNFENHKISDANENNSHYEQITTIHNIESLNDKPLIEQRNQHSYLPRSLPAYMSPIPTKRESNQINNAEEDIFPRRIFTNSYRIPRAVQPLLETSSIVNDRRPRTNYETYSVIREDGLDSKHLIARPTDNQMHPNENIIFLNSVDAQSSNAGVRHNIQASLPVNDRQRINVLPNIVREPVQLSKNPTLQIVQKPFTSPEDFYQHDMKKREHDNGHIEYDSSVNVKQSNRRKIQITNGEHMYKHIVNESLAANEKHNVHAILSSPRIQAVLSTTKHRKRYLVVHPNGRIEHVDNLEPITKDHSNYVLVNAGQIIPSLHKSQNIRFESPITALNAQQPTTTNTEIILEPLLQTTIIENHDVGIDSSSDTVLTDRSVTQLSSTQKVSADSVIDTESVTEPQISIISEQVKPPGYNTEVTGLTTSVNVSSKEEHPDLPIETLSSSSADKAAVANTSEIIEVPESEQKEAGAVSEANPSIAQDIMTKQNEQHVDLGKVLLKDTEVVDVNSSGKPVAWFNTSDPDYWNILTGGQETDIIYFFNVNSRPRIEKDTTRTIFPDGSVLEELTESIWYNEDDAVPVVTKTSRIIQPDDS